MYAAELQRIEEPRDKRANALYLYYLPAPQFTSPVSGEKMTVTTTELAKAFMLLSSSQGTA